MDVSGRQPDTQTDNVKSGPLAKPMKKITGKQNMNSDENYWI